MQRFYFSLVQSILYKRPPFFFLQQMKYPRLDFFIDFFCPFLPNDRNSTLSILQPAPALVNAPINSLTCGSMETSHGTSGNEIGSLAMVATGNRLRRFVQSISGCVVASHQKKTSEVRQLQMGYRFTMTDWFARNGMLYLNGYYLDSGKFGKIAKTWRGFIQSFVLIRRSRLTKWKLKLSMMRRVCVVEQNNNIM